MNMIKGFVGSYDASEKSGIYTFTFDCETKTFVQATLMKQMKNVKYLTYEYETLCAACMIDQPSVFIQHEDTMQSIQREEHVACFITQDETYVYSANYHDGSIQRYKKQGNTLLWDSEFIIGSGAGAHQVILHEDEVYVPCRLLDQLYVLDRTTLTLKNCITFEKGSGPRHGVMNHDGYLYLLFEDLCHIYELDMKKDGKILREVIVHEEGNQGAAAIALSKDGKYVYASLRECNQIVVVDRKTFTIVQTIDCGGKHPRDMAIEPNQEFVFSVNRLTNSLVAFYRDEKTGVLEYCDTQEGITEGVSIAFE